MSEKWSKLGAELWLEAKSIGGTPAEAYFRGRGYRSCPDPRFSGSISPLSIPSSDISFRR